MKKIVSLASYKIDKGIVPPNSPYSTKNATSEQIHRAVIRAKEYLKSFDQSNRYRYAVVIGYEDKHGRVRLLLNQHIFSTKSAFERMAGMATMKTVAVIHKADV